MVAHMENPNSMFWWAIAPSIWQLVAIWLPGIDLTNSEEVRLSNVCNIESWTKLSAAGAPSEFSIRAPILGGISTAYVSFEHGTKGVFLLVDDEGTLPDIGSKGEIVVRRIYGQEGQMRYGTKLRIID